jgi:hypothetical protein
MVSARTVPRYKQGTKRCSEAQGTFVYETLANCRLCAPCAYRRRLAATPSLRRTLMMRRKTLNNEALRGASALRRRPSCYARASHPLVWRYRDSVGISESGVAGNKWNSHRHSSFFIRRSKNPSSIVSRVVSTVWSQTIFSGFTRRLRPTPRCQQSERIRDVYETLVFTGR